MAAAAPAAAAGARTAAKKVAGKAAPAAAPGLPEKGSWRQRSQGSGSGSSSRRGPAKAKTSTLLKGESGKWRRLMIAEFIVCVMLLGLSPIAKPSGEMGPRRFMKRSSATCALFIILGLVAAAGRGAAKAAAMFGALVTLVLLVDQREIFGQTVKLLNTTADDDKKDAEDASASAGPDDSTSSDEEPGVIEA